MINKSIVFFDFDGVILDSMPVRDVGFRETLKAYDSALVEELIKFHRDNGGLSRFVKFKYFFENILHQSISDASLKELADQFSVIMRQELSKEKYMIQDSVDYIKKTASSKQLHIVSGSEHNELNYLCQQLDLAQYFISIDGSPTPKNKLVSNLIAKYHYNKNEIVLIGDSVNDYEAAQTNGIDFYGYNDVSLKAYAKQYITTFAELK